MQEQQRGGIEVLAVGLLAVLVMVLAMPLLSGVEPQLPESGPQASLQNVEHP